MRDVPAKPRIGVTETVREALLDALASRFDVAYEPAACETAGRLVGFAATCDAIVTRSRTLVTADVVEKLPRLRCVAVYGAGREHLCLPALDAAGVKVVRCSEEIALTIAEFTVGLAFCLLRRIAEANEHVGLGRWDHAALTGMDLAGKVVAVVGCGPIGLAVARLFSLLGTEVILVRKSRRPLPEWLAQRGCRLESLHSALAVADVVTLHVPGGSGTRRLLSTSELEIMKPSSFLINTSRGSVVDLQAVIRAVQERRLQGAALDVLPAEPPLSIVRHPRIIYSPHLALYSTEAIDRRISSICDALCQFFFPHQSGPVSTDSGL